MHIPAALIQVENRVLFEVGGFIRNFFLRPGAYFISYSHSYFVRCESFCVIFSEQFFMQQMLRFYRIAGED